MKQTRFVVIAACLVIQAVKLPLAAADKCLILGTLHPPFSAVAKDIEQKLGDDFVVERRSVTQTTSSFTLENYIRTVSPQIVVLMDNCAIARYREFQASLPDSVPVLPSVCLMGVMINVVTSGIKNTVGISYELPINTVVTSFKQSTGHSTKRVGVPYRRFFKKSITVDSALCAAEGVEVISYELPNRLENPAEELSNALRYLVKDRQVDAVWVPNDNALLRQYLLFSSWRMLREWEIPTFVGVKTLMNPAIGLGSFALLPNQESFAGQTVELIQKCRANGWTHPKTGVVLPVETVVLKSKD